MTVSAVFIGEDILAAKRTLGLGGVGHRAGVQVGLRDDVVGLQVIASFGESGVVRRLRAGHGRLVICHREWTDQGDVAGVGQLVAVADGLVDTVVGRRGSALDKRQRRQSDGSDRGGRLVGGNRISAKGRRGCGSVGNRAGIHFRLGDGVAGRAGQRVADGQAGNRR